MRTGKTLGQILTGSARDQAQTRRRYGTVIGIGAGAVDILFDGASTVLQKVPVRGAMPKRGQRVECQRIDGVWIVG